jgi:hypothetical protein
LKGTDEVVAIVNLVYNLVLLTALSHSDESNESSHFSAPRIVSSMPSNWKDGDGASGINNMRGISWIALAGSAAHRAKNVRSQLKGDVSGGTNWRSRHAGRNVTANGAGVVEHVHIFPGWAVRRYQPGHESNSG